MENNIRKGNKMPELITLKSDEPQTIYEDKWEALGTLVHSQKSFLRVFR